ncbi:hypothetical protein [Endozoicomonas sp. 4G]|uniref:hypothetical protein n=1 Tax=Endozoicomonas sp. 4G TaxID=2872754 RepID=UPI002078D038|nr:hypothetical protein [Endozoicomonas sp. 4G]
MNSLQPNGLCRRASLIAVSGLFIGFAPLSHADYADIATSKVRAVFDQGVGLHGTVDFGKCVIQAGSDGTTPENKIPARIFSSQHEGYIKDVSVSLDNTRLARLHFDEMISPTFLVRSEDLRITPEIRPGWVIMEFRFSLGTYMEAKVQLSPNLMWTWHCGDSAINITNRFPQADEVSNKSSGEL